MSSLSVVFGDRGTGSYNKALKAKVVATEARPQTYKGREGSDKSVFTCAISDGVEVVKAVCYDQSKFPKLRVGNTLVIRDIIRKMDEGNKSVVITRTSKVLISVPLEVPEDHARQGSLLVVHRPAEEVTIIKALSSPVKKRVSITGKIIQEDESKQVKVRGDDITLKTVTVEDVTGRSKVTLWRRTAESPVRPGDHVRITDVVINVYNNQTTLQTTNFSTVEKCDATVEKKVVEVEAIGAEELQADLYLTSGESMVVPLSMLEEALKEHYTDVEMATTNGSITLEVTVSGADTLEISLVE